VSSLTVPLAINRCAAAKAKPDAICPYSKATRGNIDVTINLV
jgi:organic hydroperoxide reductase OsmC/OhrA